MIQEQKNHSTCAPWQDPDHNFWLKQTPISQLHPSPCAPHSGILPLLCRSPGSASLLHVRPFPAAIDPSQPEPVRGGLSEQGANPHSFNSSAKPSDPGMQSLNQAELPLGTVGSSSPKQKPE